ncbi:MAG: purine-cytosine permease family protein [Chloroflexota bacterium]
MAAPVVTAEPASDRVWSIETNGINAIPEDERHGRPAELFWIWFASNISLLSILYGAIAVGFGLNLWQSILAGLIGVWISFLLVGFISLAGVRGGSPTLVLSRASFGIFGNILPNLASYISLLGWEAVLVATSVLATNTLVHRLGLATGRLETAVAFVIIAGIVIGIGLLGHATILRIETWFTWAFAILTVVFVVLEAPHIHLSALASAPSGNWLSGFIPAVSIIMAGLGIGWVNAAADYSRYLPRRASGGSVVAWTTVGASIAPFLLIVFGALLAGSSPQLAKQAGGNPITGLAQYLPTWFLVPYLIAAVGGLVAGAVLDIYSSGLNLLTLGVRLARYKSVAIDGTVMVLGNIYILFVASNFLNTFQGFLFALGVPLAVWSAIFLVDMAMFHRQGYNVAALYAVLAPYRIMAGVNPAAVVAFIAGTVVGLGLVTNATFTWLGWWTSDLPSSFANSSIGLFVGFGIGAVLYFLLSVPRLLEQRQLEEAPSL